MDIFNKNAVAYYRVSTSEQTVENQRLTIKQFAEARNIKIIKEYVDNAVSGKTPPLKRSGFKNMINDLNNGVHADLILVYEISRIGRTLRECLDAIWKVEKHAPIITVSPKEAFLQTLDRSIRDLILMIFAWASERERELLIQRTKEGIARARLDGKRIGRPPREISKDVIEELIMDGVPKVYIAKTLGISRTTLYNKLKEYNL